MRTVRWHSVIAAAPAWCPGNPQAQLGLPFGLHHRPKVQHRETAHGMCLLVWITSRDSVVPSLRREFERRVDRVCYNLASGGDSVGSVLNHDVPRING